MPLLAIEYSKTIIYKIQHKERSDLFYIGHTTNFPSRKKQHKKSARVETGPLYLLIQANGGWDQFDMTPIKQVECKNRIDALIEEQTAIDELKATMNYNPSYKKNAKYDLDHYRREYVNMKASSEASKVAKEKQYWDRVIKHELRLLEQEKRKRDITQ